MMFRFFQVPVFVLLLSCSTNSKDASSVVGDSGTVRTDSGQVDADSGTGPATPVDYAEIGPFKVLESSTVVQVDSECEMQTIRFQPEGGSNAAIVILAHGFARGEAQMSGWARHLASWGIDVVTPKLCHASITDTDHVANGNDLVGLGQALGAGPVVYAGHSAGGLAAVLAGASDSKTLAVVGLDLTDVDDLGVEAAKGLSAPFYGLLGEPGNCNSSGNGLSVYEQAPVAMAYRVTDADHCDFENETDALCTVFCQGSGGTFDDPSIRSTLLGMLTAAVVDAVELEEGLQCWWNEGGHYADSLLDSGAIQAL
jgi:pimeloyl-ACP methyl ester carboxylesterase